MQSLGRRSRIAAVVVTYNRCERLKGCLDSLIRQDRPLDEILVIDNASTDDTSDVLKKKYDGRITYVRLEENLGGSAGFYEGIRLACEKGHDWVWVMDDDVEPEPGAVVSLVNSPAFTDPSVGLLGSLILNAEMTAQLWMYCRFNSTMARCSVVTESDLGSPILPIEGGSFVGSLIRREAVEAVGLPIKEFFIYWDDTEYTYRVAKQFKAFLVPSSKVIHRNAVASQPPRRLLGLLKVPAGIPFGQSWRSYYLVRNGIFFRTRNGKPWLAPYIFVACLARPAAVALILRDHKIARCKLLWQAAVDGVLGRLGKRVGP